MRWEANPILILIACLDGPMSLFRKAGKKFEETKQSVLEGKSADFVCESCKEQVSKDYEYCPHCGKDAIVPLE